MPTPTRTALFTADHITLKALKNEALIRGLFGILMILVILNALSGTVADPDLWGYMAFGRLFWETGRFPYQDTFAYVPTLKVWVYHEWLTGVIFYPIYRALGAAGLQLLKIALGLATVWLVYRTARRRGANFWSALLGLWFVQVFLATGYSPVRAQLFTYFFFALSLYVLESARLSGRWRGLIILVIIQIFWCNLHGGFLAGLGLLFLYGLGEAVSRRPFRPYLAALAAAALATLINPYGLDYWHYLFRAVTMPRPEITEWASLFKAWQTGFPREPLIYFVSLALFSGFLVWWAKWRELTPGLILALTLYMGLKHLRHQVFFLLAAGAYLPVLFEAYGRKILASPPLAAWRPRLGQLLPVALALSFMLVYGYKVISAHPLALELPAAPDQTRRVGIHYPVGAVEFLEKNRLAGNILNEFNWGEYLIWALPASCKVAMDGRYETVYGDDLCQLHSEFFYGRPGWRKFLEQYPPDLILVDPRSKVYALLKAAPDWRQVYEDAGAALFLPQRQDPVLSLQNP
jgi:hypothetical protein